MARRKSRRHSTVVPRESSAGSSPTATIAELVSSGAGVLAVAADASRRAALANGATGLARFNGGAALIACHRCGAETVADLATRADSGLALADYAALAMAPDLASHFEHVVLVDAPARRRRRAVARGPRGPSRAQSPARRAGAARLPGFLHPLFSAAEHAFSLGVLGRQAPSRETIAGVFRALRDRRANSAARSCAPPSPGRARTRSIPRPPPAAFRVLLELGLVAGRHERGRRRRQRRIL